MVLLIALPLSVLPSIFKPIKKKSTEGMSPMTLLLTNIQQTCTVVNTVLMKSPQVKMCATYPWGCQATLITLYHRDTSLGFVVAQLVCQPARLWAACWKVLQLLNSTALAPN